MRRRHFFWSLVVATLLAACSDDSTTRDQGADASDASEDFAIDAVADADAGPDQGAQDVLSDPAPGDTVDEPLSDLTDGSLDDAAPDVAGDLAGDAVIDLADEVSADAMIELDAAAATPPLPGFGAISGDCDFLDDTEWGAMTSSFVFVNQIDFGDDPYDEADYDRLTDGGREIIDDGNLNPGSLMSEVFAYEVLARCELAALLATENEVTYSDPDGPKTDFLARIDDRQIGVSVTRAHPFDNPFDAARAQELLEDKLQGVLDSTANVTGEDVWERQILHVVAADQGRVDALLTAFPLISTEIRSSTILVITRGDGDDSPIW